MKQEDKSVQYSMKLLSALQTCFDEDSENYIGKKELLEGNNLTDFMHALFNMVPTRVYNEFTNDGSDILKCNHIANKLIFQYVAESKEDEGE